MSFMANFNCFVVRYFTCYAHFSFAIILMGNRELVALLNLSSWCLVIVVWLFLAMPRGFLQFLLLVFLEYTHLLFYCVMR